MKNKVKQSDLTGDIKDFPIEIVQKMCERQVEQGRKFNPAIFSEDSLAFTKGFDWSKTTEEYGFWNEVIDNKNFDVFFEKYPKSLYPKMMRVWDAKSRNAKLKRLVLKEVRGKYLAYDPNIGLNGSTNDLSEILENALITVSIWDNAEDIDEALELTLHQIAEKFDVDVKQIKIIE